MNSILNPALIILNKKQKNSKEIIYDIILGANKLIKLSLKTQESKIFELLLSQPSFDEQSNLLQKFPNLKVKLSEKNLIFSNIPQTTERYSRNDLFEKLFAASSEGSPRNKKVLVIGVGGIGSNVAEFLARSGFNLVIVDEDTVDISNLSRQNYREKDIHSCKVKALSKRIQAINSEVTVDPIILHIKEITDLIEVKSRYVVDFVLIAGDSSINLQRYCYEIFSKNKIPAMAVGYVNTFGVIAPIINSVNRDFERKVLGLSDYWFNITSSSVFYLLHLLFETIT